MEIEAARVKLFRNFVDEQVIHIEPDVTCLAGKNESGKTHDLEGAVPLEPRRYLRRRRL